MSVAYQMLVLIFLLSGCGVDVFEEDLEAVDAAACSSVLEALGDCYDNHCQQEDASERFCACWGQGNDIDVQDCSCRKFNAQGEVCRAYENGGFGAEDVDCNHAIDSFVDECANDPSAP